MERPESREFSTCMLRRAFVFFLMLAFLVIGFAHSAIAAVVYDNSSDYQNVYTSTGYYQTGDEISLSRTEREVVELHIGVKMPGKSGTCDFQARMYANDGPEGEPGTMLWASELMEAVPLSGVEEFIVFDVPNVTVPDTFTWTLQTFNPQPIIVGLPWYGPASIGSSAAHGWWGNETSWNKSVPGQFGDVKYLARVIAVPEPGSILLLSLGGIALRRRLR